ncbi:hypothetical protein HK096_009950, partial [Nowakowskiella sp. JEL0078]
MSERSDKATAPSSPSPASPSPLDLFDSLFKTSLYTPVCTRENIDWDVFLNLDEVDSDLPIPPSCEEHLSSPDVYLSSSLSHSQASPLTPPEDFALCFNSPYRHSNPSACNTFDFQDSLTLKGYSEYPDCADPAHLTILPSDPKASKLVDMTPALATASPWLMPPNADPLFYYYAMCFAYQQQLAQQQVGFFGQLPLPIPMHLPMPLPVPVIDTCGEGLSKLLEEKAKLDVEASVEKEKNSTVSEPPSKPQPRAIQPRTSVQPGSVMSAEPVITERKPLATATSENRTKRKRSISIFTHTPPPDDDNDNYSSDEKAERLERPLRSLKRQSTVPAESPNTRYSRRIRQESIALESLNPVKRLTRNSRRNTGSSDIDSGYISPKLKLDDSFEDEESENDTATDAESTSEISGDDDAEEFLQERKRKTPISKKRKGWNQKTALCELCDKG